MKVRLESRKLQNRGVALVSETEEEKKVLSDIWNFNGAPVALDRLHDGNVEIVVAPTPEKLEGGTHGDREG